MEQLRAEFPVLRRLSYLNAGTNGPVPARAIAAADEELRRQAEDGRGDKAFFTEYVDRAEALRARVADWLACGADEIALTSSTTGGVNTVLPALRLGKGDEVLTSDEEHPGVLAPLAVGRVRDGFDVRMVPFAELPGEVGPQTRLIAVSHVSWVSGRVADTAALAGSGLPVLLDGAQGFGAVPTELPALGCQFYAASGQKWACGPNGVGYLYVERSRIADLLPPAPGFGSLAQPDRAAVLELDLVPTARRFDSFLPAPQHTAWALAALDVLEMPGREALHARATDLADRLADTLREAGLEVAPRGRSTLVSWRAADAEAETARLRAEGVIVRFLPGLELVRASVGAWTSEEELDRLVELAAGRAS